MRRIDWPQDRGTESPFWPNFTKSDWRGFFDSGQPIIWVRVVDLGISQVAFDRRRHWCFATPLEINASRHQLCHHALDGMRLDDASQLLFKSTVEILRLMIGFEMTTDFAIVTHPMERPADACFSHIAGIGGFGD